MMETKFQRRTARPNENLGVPKGSLSPKGTIKKRKQDRKTRERKDQEMCYLNTQLGRLEDRDTQQQAFATLIQLLPGLDYSLVKEVYTLIEKNKVNDLLQKPTRSSTRRMLVLLIAALCKCHPVQTAKLLPRIVSYACLRLRDRHAKTTDACVILMSAIALYVLPCPTVSLPGGQASPRRRRVHDSTLQPFEAVAEVFAREVNAVGEAATKCICGLLHPVDFDGVSVPGPSTILAHATRIRPFFKTLLAETVEMMDGSTMFTTFSPMLMLLQSAVQLARNANEKSSFTQLGDDFAPFISSIYEAIEDSFQCGPREDWVLRKRGLELLTMLLDTFVLPNSPWCSSVAVAREYFQAHLERVRALVLAGRHDSVSLVREAAIPAIMAIEYLEKLYPQAASGPLLNTSFNYDFDPPNAPGYSFTGKRWTKPAAINDRHAHIPIASDARVPLPPSKPIEEVNTSNFGDATIGDETLPSQNLPNDGDNLPAVSAANRQKIYRSRSNRRVNSTASIATDAKWESVLLPTELNQDDERFMDLLMDHAIAPESGDQADFPQSGDEEINGALNDEGSKAHKTPTTLSSTGAQVASRTVSRPSTATKVENVATLQQFAAKQRARLRSRRSQPQETPQISLPKQRSSQAIHPLRANNSPREHTKEINARNHEDDESTDELKLTRAEATLEAAQCGEYELAFRLCIVEDDLELLRRTMTTIATPCMTTLSASVRNALITAFLSLLDGDDDETSSDVWLALQWLQLWATDMKIDRRQFDQLDPRVARAISTKLSEMATASTKSALAAAHVLFLLGM